jgi:hypothetical protein
MPHFVRLDPQGVLNKEKASQRWRVNTGGLFHDPFGGCLTKKKPCQPPSSASGVFYFFTYAFKLRLMLRLK